MKILIGIDDTDNHESRGTGFHARELGRLLTESGAGTMTGVTRHQLLFDRRIPYTSHNSSACIEIEKPQGCLCEIIVFCEEFLKRESAEGSDAGLCIADADRVSKKIIDWGLRAKKEILNQKEAREISDSESIFLEGYTGDKGGITGSLAAVGLRKGGNDGRFLWIKGMREMSGVFTADEIKVKTGVDKILTINNELVTGQSKIFLGDWWRPVMKNNKIIIFVEQIKEKDYGWQVVSKDYIKSISG